jgi:hypothetical protein
MREKGKGIARRLQRPRRELRLLGELKLEKTAAAGRKLHDPGKIARRVWCSGETEKTRTFELCGELSLLFPVR